jgi:biopolymer transport protein ExbD
MRRAVFIVLALLMIGIGGATLWYMNRPSPSSSALQVQIPHAPSPLTREQIAALPNDDSSMFVVSIEKGGHLRLNGSVGVGGVADPSPLTTTLRGLFDERVRSRAFAPEMEKRTDLSDEARTLKVQLTVRAPRSVPNQDVMRVVEAAKSGGVNPILLQVDDLPQ